TGRAESFTWPTVLALLLSIKPVPSGTLGIAAVMKSKARVCCIADRCCTLLGAAAASGGNRASMLNGRPHTSSGQMSTWAASCGPAIGWRGRDGCHQYTHG